jgi:hypothetical protein
MPGVHFGFSETSENASIGLSKPASIETVARLFYRNRYPGRNTVLSVCLELLPGGNPVPLLILRYLKCGGDDPGEEDKINERS